MNSDQIQHNIIRAPVIFEVTTDDKESPQSTHAVMHLRVDGILHVPRNVFFIDSFAAGDEPLSLLRVGLILVPLLYCFGCGCVFFVCAECACEKRCTILSLCNV